MEKKKKILFVVSHRKNRSPGQKFRFEQYFDFLEANGFECHFSPLLNEKDDKEFYSKGNYFSKARIFLKSARTRFRDLSKKNNYDIIFIFREAIMTGSTYFERRFAKSGAKLVFDFDDSIWLQDVSDANRNLAFLKNPSKTKNIIQIVDLVFAGNEYLANYARQFNKNVTIIPTTIDTTQYVPGRERKANEQICIGWTGSFTTIKHFEHRLEALKKIREKYGERIRFKVIGDGTYTNEQLGVKGIPWKHETEIAELQDIDIGIMPLPADEWAKGKCGLKGLQYMALEIPTIMSPVGVNTEIIQHGENGFLAETTEEWVNCIETLIEDAELRKKVGAKARQTVIEKYSVEAQKGNYLKFFGELVRDK